MPSATEGSTKQFRPPHDIRHIATFTGEPGQVGHAGGLEDGFALGAQRAVSDQHQAQPAAQVGIRLQCLHEGLRQVGLRLHRLHAADGARQPQLRVVERAAGNRLAAAGSDAEAPDVDAVVDLRDAARRDADTSCR